MGEARIGRKKKKEDVDEREGKSVEMACPTTVNHYDSPQIQRTH